MSDTNKTSFSSRLFQWIWGLPFLLAAITIFLTPWPPMLDWPLHIAQGTLLARLDDPSFVSPGVYCRSPFVAYHLFHHLIKWVVLLVGPDWVSRCVLGLLFLWFTFSVWFLLRCYRADKRLLALSVPFFFGFHYIMGFGPFMLGIGAFFLSIGVAEWWSREGGWKLASMLSVSLFFAYTCHPLVLYLSLVALGLRWWVQWAWVPRLRWPSFAALFLPGLVSIAHIFQNQAFSAKQNIWWKAIRENLTGVNWTQAEPNLLVKLFRLPLYIVGTEELVWHDALLGWCLFGVISALFVGSLRKRSHSVPKVDDTSEREYSNDERDEKFARWGRWAVIFVPFAFYFGLNMAIGHINYIFPRFAFFSVILMMTSVLAKEHSENKNLLLWLGLCLSIVFGVNNLMYHMDWSRSMRGLRLVVDKIPKNSRVLGLLTHRKHAPSIIQTYRGGEARISFSYLPHMPVRDCRPFRQLKTWKFTRFPGRFRPKEHPDWDYLILYIHGGSRLMRRRFPWLFEKTSLYQPAFKAGAWLLVKRRKQKKN